MSKLRSTAILGAARLVNLGVVLLSMRFYLQWIGEEMVGAIIVLQGIAAYCVSLGDSGLGPGVQAQLVDAQVAGDTERTNRLVSSHRVFMLISGLLAIVIHVCLIGLIPLKGMPSDQRSVLFFVLSGVSVSGYLAAIAYTSYLAAQNRFGSIAVANLASGLVYSLSSLGLVYWTRHPWGFSLGSVLGQATGLVFLHVSCSKAGLRLPGWRYFKSEFAPCIGFIRKSIFSSIGDVLAGLDRLIANGIVGTGPVGSMGVAQRVPKTVSMALPFMQVFQPEYARSYLAGIQEFQKTYWRNSCATLAISTAFMFLPTCFGESLLKLWLGDEFIPVLVPMLIFFGLETATQANNIAFGLSANAAMKPGWLVPFVWFHGLSIVILTGPVLHTWGIVGIPVMRVALSAVQMPILDWVMARHIAPGLRYGPLLLRKAALLSVAGLLWALGVWTASSSAVRESLWLGVALSTLWIYAYLAIVGAMRLVEFPKSLLRFFPMVRVRAESVPPQ